jgi:hypothetical protein
LLLHRQPHLGLQTPNMLDKKASAGVLCIVVVVTKFWKMDLLAINIGIQPRMFGHSLKFTTEIIARIIVYFASKSLVVFRVLYL